MQGAFTTLWNKRDDFEILAVGLESISKLTSYLNKKGLAYEFPMLYDKSNNIPSTYRSGFVPDNYMIDKWGYFYTAETVSSNSEILSFRVGSMGPSETLMASLINGAIKRVEDYKKPWEK